MNVLEAKELQFSYAGRSVLQNVSFTLKKGEIVTLIGRSGAGKSTLFKLLAGLLPRQKGSLSLSPNAYMVQEDLLLPWRTVLANVTLTGELGLTSLPKQELIEKSRELLKRVGLEGYEDLLPSDLSGGMRQRVLLARALILNRPLLLLDEPFTALDLLLREQMYILLREIQHERGATVLMVTHDFRDALHLSDRVLLLQKGEISKEWVVQTRCREDGAVFGAMYTTLREAMS